MSEKINQHNKKHELTVSGGDEDIRYTDISKILPPFGSVSVAENANPFDKENWNMAKQSKIFKENPQIAKYLASSANQYF